MAIRYILPMLILTACSASPQAVTITNATSPYDATWVWDVDGSHINMTLKGTELRIDQCIYSVEVNQDSIARVSPFAYGDCGKLNHAVLYKLVDDKLIILTDEEQTLTFTRGEQ